MRDIFLPPRRQALALLLTPLVLIGPLPAALAARAAAVPDTRSMIEALRPQNATRNLQVRVKPAAGEASGVGAGATMGTGTGTPVETTSVAGADGAPAPAAPVAPPSLSLALPFEANSSRLRPESGNVLGNLVAAMQSPELTGNRFIIEGHTDARGSAAANQRLSEQRAEEVRLYLVTLGVHPARLKTTGKGSSEPANTADPLAAENRRVRVVLAP